jgi:hypothetical protein
MKKSKMEEACAEWLAEHLDPEDKEQLAAFRKWMEQGADDPARSLTVQEVIAAWQRLVEEKKVH